MARHEREEGRRAGAASVSTRLKTRPGASATDRTGFGLGHDKGFVVKRLTLALLVTVASMPAAGAATLDRIEARGKLECGVGKDQPGFSVAAAGGAWSGLDVDFCRALASAVFADPSKVEFVSLSAEAGLTALRSGQIDVLSRNTTWTMSLDTDPDLAVPVVTYYDGQGFMVRNSIGVTSALQLSGASVCAAKDDLTQQGLADYFHANGMEYQLVASDKAGETLANYQAGRCDAYTADLSALYVLRLKLPAPDKHAILPEVISKRPLGPVVRRGDEQWRAIVRWTHYAMVEAEESGVTQANADEMLKSDNPRVRRLLGVDGNFGGTLGLKKDWAYQIVKGVGDYGDAFNRNLGAGTSLAIARGLNALWKRGGLQYAPPMR